MAAEIGRVDDELGSLIIADQRLAIDARHQTVLFLRSVVAYSTGIELDLIVRRVDLSDGADWQYALYTDDPRSLRLGFSYDDPSPTLGKVVNTGTAVPTVDILQIGGGSGPDGASWRISLRLRPAPDDLKLHIGWSWLDAGIPASSQTVTLLQDS